MTSDVLLRDVIEADLSVFFDHQQDPDATRLAGFPARGREAHIAHWRRILADERVIAQTILLADQVAGNVVSWDEGGRRLVGYWIGKEYWGRGVATAALALFLGLVCARPLYAHVAGHNAASLRVLAKCGFAICDEETNDAVACAGVDEVVLILR
jgi:RimJ/RimL family protein N-acetyltransferase